MTAAWTLSVADPEEGSEWLPNSMVPKWFDGPFEPIGYFWPPPMVHAKSATGLKINTQNINTQSTKEQKN